MAVIYLTHPTHGDKVASSEMEAKHDREHGWMDYDPKDRVQSELPAFLGGGPSDLPENFPGRLPLIEGGLMTWASLQGKTLEDFKAIRGIGQATAESIVKALDV